MASTTNQTSMTGPKNWATAAVPRDCAANSGQKDDHRDRQHRILHARGDELQAFHRRQHRDGRGDHRIAIEEGGADHAEHQEQRRAALGHRLAERHQRKGAALALVVGVEQHDHILERDDQQQRPGHQRQDAEHGVRARRAMALGGRHRLAQRIEGAGADVAVDDADRSKRQGPELLVGVPVLGAVGGGCLCHWRRLLESGHAAGWVGWRRLIHPPSRQRKPARGRPSIRAQLGINGVHSCGRLHKVRPARSSRRQMVQAQR